MTKTAGAEPFVPKHATLALLREAAESCRGCDLYLQASRAVLGEGPVRARVVLIGEQPGDAEDREGRPFVGPAGRLLDRALTDAGLKRSEVYLTNSVKHFKFEERGKRRIHKKPNLTEVRACHPWLEAELRLIRPAVIGCLGATAAQSLLGPQFRLTRERGVPVDHPYAGLIVATVHPSAILRAPDPEKRQADYQHFVSDLTVIRRLIQANRSLRAKS